MCPASDQGKRACRVRQRFRRAIANTRAADRCAQRNEGVGGTEAHGVSGPTQHSTLSGRAQSRTRTLGDCK